MAGASWSPTYDLHASTVDGHTSATVSLVYGANVTQKTGEEWNNVALTLSTATSQALKSLSIPTLPPLKLTPKPQPISTNASHRTVYYHGSVRSSRRERWSRSPSPRADISRSYSRPPSPDIVVAPPEALRQEPIKWGADAPGSAAVVLDGNPLALAYRVQGDATLPSDGLAHRVAVVTLRHLHIPTFCASMHCRGAGGPQQVRRRRPHERRGTRRREKRITARRAGRVDRRTLIGLAGPRCGLTPVGNRARDDWPPPTRLGVRPTQAPAPPPLPLHLFIFLQAIKRIRLLIG